MSSVNYLLLIAFAALLVMAAVSDLMTMKIPNRIPLLILAIFPVASVAAGFDLALIGWHLLAGAGVLAVCFAMFALGWIGGGDAKLAAANALWIGPFMPLLDWAIAATLFGGVLTLGLLLARGVPLPAMLVNQEWIARLHDEKGGVPYGIALAAAGLLVYPTTDIFVRLAV
jgi:prepilin peptidase CpaA